MLEYNRTRVLYKRMYATTRVFLLCQCLKNYIFFLKKGRPWFFKLYQALFTCNKSAAGDMATWIGAGEKFNLFVQKS